MKTHINRGNDRDVPTQINAIQRSYSQTCRYLASDGKDGDSADGDSGSADDSAVDGKKVVEEEEPEAKEVEEIDDKVVEEEEQQQQQQEIMGAGAGDDDALSANPKQPRLKYKTAKKRASMLLSIITEEQEERSKAEKPKVFDVDFAIGDSVEIEYASTVDTKTRSISKVRGVLIGMRNKGIATKIIVRDVVLDEVVEREIPLHSPLVLSLKVLTKNFVKGRQKKKIKRAKLFYLRNRPDAEVRVTGSGE